MSAAQRLVAHPELTACVDGTTIRTCGEDSGADSEVEVNDPSTWHYACEQAGLDGDSCLPEALIPAEVAVCVARSVVGSDAGAQGYVHLMGTADGGLSWRVSLAGDPAGSGRYSSASHQIDARTGEYRALVIMRAIPGRPLRAARGRGPGEEHPAELAYWLETARGELLSVPAFARHVVELEHLGAPPHLIEEARRAVRDEARHFQLAWQRVCRLAGQPLPPPRFELGEALSRPVLVEDVLREVVEMGCINETLSAHEALQLAMRCEDVHVRAIWEAIAQDEARHAALAWQVMAWILERWPSLRVVARHCFERSRAGGGGVASEAKELQTSLAHRGAASNQERDAWAATALAKIVAPMAQELLG